MSTHLMLQLSNFLSPSEEPGGQETQRPAPNCAQQKQVRLGKARCEASSCVREEKLGGEHGANGSFPNSQKSTLQQAGNGKYYQQLISELERQTGQSRKLPKSSRKQFYSSAGMNSSDIQYITAGRKEAGMNELKKHEQSHD